MATSRRNNSNMTPKPLPRISESRKVRKPLMEKKRRARINQSLNDLKRLLLESNSVKKEGSRPTKLEKADILELTVSHVQKLHQQQQWMDLMDSKGLKCHADESTVKFKAGFSECARLVRELLQTHSRHIDTGLEQRLSEHLNRCLKKFDPSDPSYQINENGQVCSSPICRSPSPVSSSSSVVARSDSRSSFEGKETVLLSPQSPLHPFNYNKSPPPSLLSVHGSGGGGGGGGVLQDINTVVTVSNTTAVSRSTQRELWTSKSAFVCHGDTRSLTADLNTEYLTSCRSSHVSEWLRTKETNGSNLSPVISSETLGVGSAFDSISAVEYHKRLQNNNNRRLTCHKPVTVVVAQKAFHSDEDDELGHQQQQQQQQQQIHSPISSALNLTASHLQQQVAKSQVGNFSERQMVTSPPCLDDWPTSETNVIELKPQRPNLLPPPTTTATAAAAARSSTDNHHQRLLRPHHHFSSIPIHSTTLPHSKLDEQRVWRPW